jgi:hypothetical protein
VIDRVGTLKKDPELIARKIAHLIALRLEGGWLAEWIYTTDHDKLFAIFANDSWSVLEMISKLSGKAEGPDKHMLTQIAQFGFSNYWLKCGLPESGSGQATDATPS